MLAGQRGHPVVVADEVRGGQGDDLPVAGPDGHGLSTVVAEGLRGVASG